MENKIVLFANMKGGVGKSTLCATFANYLVAKGVPVVVLDADIQRSILGHRERELEAEPGAQIPWQVQFLDTAKAKDVLPKLKKLPGVVLIDTPGNIYDANLQHIFKAADLCLVPLTYDSDNIDSTRVFSMVVKKVSDAKLVFIPNNIVTIQEKSASVSEDRSKAYAALKDLGYITPKIKQSLTVKQYSTLQPLDRYKTNAVQYAFEPIIDMLK